MQKIKGGYYMKARQIQESDISNAPPHVREIWDWLLKECNHEDNPRINIKRGQCVRSYKDIQEGLSWYVGYRKEKYSKWQCETAMKWLTKHDMVTTMKTTVGLKITVEKYDFYQNPTNYENHKETTRKPQCTDTINKNGKNVKNEKKEIYIVDIPPKREKVEEYIKNNGYPVDIDKWFAHYEAIGWKVGKNKMKSWEAAVRTWLPNGWHKKKKESKLPKSKCCNAIMYEEANMSFCSKCHTEVFANEQT